MQGYTQNYASRGHVPSDRNGDSVTKVGDVGDHITNDGGTEQGRRKRSGESNGAITIGDLATRVALLKESRGCEAVSADMQLIDTKIKFKLQSFE